MAVDSNLDVNGDGNIDIVDALTIARYDAGLITTWPSPTTTTTATTGPSPLYGWNTSGDNEGWYIGTFTDSGRAVLAIVQDSTFKLEGAGSLKCAVDFSVGNDSGGAESKGCGSELQHTSQQRDDLLLGVRLLHRSP